MIPWWVKGLGLAVLLAVVYRVECWWRPWAPCWCCKGDARHWRSDGKTFRDCWWCRGTGRRRRVAARRDRP